MKNDMTTFTINRRDEVLRELLKNEFQRRLQKNPAFSLRAYARKIGIDQSLLSKILQGKRPFSQIAADKAATFLGIFLKPELTTPSSYNLRDYDFIKEDEFFIISDWYHFAILELLKTKNCKHSIPYIAQRLKITQMDAERAIQRLTRLGFLTEENKKWVLTKINNTWIDFAKTTAARKKLQKSLQEKSLEALEDISFEHREHSSLTIAIHPKHLPEIKQKITEFRRSLDTYIEQQGPSKEVYNLCVSFFPLSKINDKESL